MRPKLLIVGGLLALAIVCSVALAWFLFHDERAARMPPIASTSFPNAAFVPPNTSISDMWVRNETPDEVLSEPLRALGARVSQALNGHVLYNPPLTMMVDDSERIEVRIAPADYTDNIRTGLVGRGTPQVETIEITPVMRVRLRGGAFKVDPPIGEAQTILSGRVAQWSFDVTPIRAGKQTLELEVSYLIIVNGNSYLSILPTFRREIDIQISTWHAVMATMKDHRELAMSTAIGVTLGLTGFFLKLWYMERRARKVREVAVARAAPRPRKKRRR